VWGYLDGDPDGDLLALRRSAFAEVSHPADYMRLRQVVDAVPAETLRLTHQKALAEYARDWRALLQLDELASSDGH
jgi:hypothetical protein